MRHTKCAPHKTQYSYFYSLLHNSCGMLGVFGYTTVDSEQITILFNLDATSICVDGNTCAYR